MFSIQWDLCTAAGAAPTARPSSDEGLSWRRLYLLWKTRTATSPSAIQKQSQ